jgi:hypothetical protein
MVETMIIISDYTLVLKEHFGVGSPLADNTLVPFSSNTLPAFSSIFL